MPLDDYFISADPERRCDGFGAKPQCEAGMMGRWPMSGAGLVTCTQTGQSRKAKAASCRQSLVGAPFNVCGRVITCVPPAAVIPHRLTSRSPPNFQEHPHGRALALPALLCPCLAARSLPPFALTAPSLALPPFRADRSVARSLSLPLPP